MLRAAFIQAKTRLTGGQSASFHTTCRALGFGSHMCDNDPFILAAEKKRTLHRMHMMCLKY